MQITFKLTQEGKEPITVKTVVGDLIAWERKTGNKISDLQNGAGMEDLSFLAYSCVKRGEPDTADFDTWVNTLVGIEAEAADPKSMETVQ